MLEMITEKSVISSGHLGNNSPQIISAGSFSLDPCCPNARCWLEADIPGHLL